MNRRSALKYLGVAASAAAMFPSCVADVKKLSLALNNLQITGEEEELLAEIADTIIPTTDSPGAKATGAHLFALVMVDDCLSKEEQQVYLTGMRSFQNEIKSASGKSFLNASAEEKAEMLIDIEQDKSSSSGEIKKFYNTTKRYTLQGYLASQYFLTEVKPYKHIPGPVFNGCKPLSNDKFPS